MQVTSHSLCDQCSSREDELARARADADRARELVATHGKVHELIAAGAPLEDVLVELIKGVECQDPSVLGCVVLLDRESSTLHPGAGPSLPAHWLEAIDGVVIGPNVGSCGAAAWSGELKISSDIATDPNWAPIRDFAADAGFRHCWSMPIKSSEDEVLGTFALYGGRARTPTAEHLTLMKDGARVAGIAIERGRTLDRLMHDARHDGLTGLPNRTRIFDALDQAIVRSRPGSKVAVMFVDVDGLKHLNDTLGHDQADEIIREIGERLSCTIRGEDFVGRFGGDEFIVIAEAMPDEEQAAALGHRLLDAISRPLPGIDSRSVTASIGITLLGGADLAAREALRQADSAMYDAKRAGRDRCAFFAGSRLAPAGRRLAIARGLRGAELRDELSLVFQPVFELPGGEVAAVEALLRWSSPQLGDVSPGEFIPIAEDTGSIIAIGAWVMRESCDTIAEISAQLGRPIEVSVNVSALQLGRPGFVQSVRQTLAHAGLPAASLRLEITESALMRPDAVTIRSLRELEALGVHAALDDFGTGFSSLSLLKRHPLAAIKIDRSFVTGLADDPRDRAIVAAVTNMAHALGFVVTAEGVETESQLESVRELGCDRAQGFLLARPMPQDELVRLLGAERVDASASTPVR